jgi:phosphatidylinositol kinase/protein kinase (PI-3  family)
VMSVRIRASGLIVMAVRVFLHDPLYRWALSPLKLLRIQREEEESEESAVRWPFFFFYIVRDSFRMTRSTDAPIVTSLP